MSLQQKLEQRANNQCELCESTESLSYISLKDENLNMKNSTLDNIDIYEPDNYVEQVPLADFAKLRERAPVFWHPHPDGGGYWVVSRHEDVVAVSKDFNTFSAQFTVSGSNPNLGEGGDSDGAQSIPSFSSDGVIFTSAKAGPIAWNATGSPAESVPEPSSTLLLGLGSLCLLRRKR